MKEYTLVIYSNPAHGKEQEYNDWYNNQHLSDVLTVPGFISARRYKLSDVKLDEAMPEPPHRYVAFYNMKTDNPEAALTDLRTRVETGLIGLSESMDPNFMAYCYEAASELCERKAD